MLISNANVSATACGERIKVTFSEPRVYALIEVEMEEK